MTAVLADTDWVMILLLGLTLMAGAIVQSLVGFGIAVVAAPFVVVFAPDLMPGAILVTGAWLPTLELSRGHDEVDWPILSWALAGRIVTTPLGVWLVAHASATTISALVGVMVLAAVAASVRTLDVRATPRNAVLAGLITGVSGTAASLGGPFFALVLQHERAERIRATLAAFFIVGSLLGVGMLAVGGEFTLRQLIAGLAWLAFISLGFIAAGPLRDRLDRDQTRQRVLVFAAVAGITVLIRALVKLLG